MRELLVTPQFHKDIRRIPNTVKLDGDLVLKRLCRNPLDSSLNIKKLKGFKSSIWRVRIGVYRIVYSFNEKFVVCLKFRHRKDIYRA